MVAPIVPTEGGAARAEGGSERPVAGPTVPAPDAVTVVFLHGQPGGADIWVPVEQRLAGEGLATLAIDRPGYGDAELEAGGFRHNADALVEVLTPLGRPAVLVAHSWAAGPALLVAARRADLVAGLVLCAPVGDQRSVTRVDRALAKGWAGRLVMRSALAAGGWLVRLPGGEHLLPPAGLGHLPPQQARTATSPALDRRARRAAAVEQLALVEEMGEVRRAARSVRVAVAIIGGEQDGVVRAHAVRGLARLVPGARLTMVEGGHLIPAEHPDVVAEAVLAVVARDGR